MISKLPEPRKLDQHGFVPLLLTLLAVIVAVIVFAFLRVLHARG